RAMRCLALAAPGPTGFPHLAVARYPAVDLPQVTVRTGLPGAAPEEIETTVSYPIEEAVNTVEGVTELRSINVAGTSFVIITFDLKRNIDTAAQDVRDRVAGVLRRI